jgi:tetrahydromethanopterin S-methyltransferase subunit G
MATATDVDLQQLKDLITAGNAATQKQIADLALSSQQQFAKLEQRIEVGFAKVETSFAKVEGDIRELRSELKALDTKFEEKTKNLDQRITSKEFASRGILIGLTVTVVGGILLAFGKILFFGKVI